MGRKIEIKKIVDRTKCQVMFSKRRSSLLKKMQETAISCDVDVAFVAFSPAGRVHKFCAKARMDDVLQRYITLPPQERFIQIRNAQEKLERLSEVDHTMGPGDNKLDHLEKQAESLEDQITKSNEVLEFLEANLYDYEPSPEVEPSLHNYSWCERNLMQSLKSVRARKLQGKFPDSSSSSFGMPNFQTRDRPATFKLNDMELNKLKYPLAGELQKEMFNQGQGSNSTSFPGQLLTELDPWFSPYSARVRGKIFQSLLDEANGKVARNEDPFNSMKAQVAQNAPFGLQQPQQPHSFGHHVENQNRQQDGSLPLNQFNANRELLHPFPIHESGSSSMQNPGLGSNGFDQPYKVPFDWEIPEPNQQHQGSGLQAGFSNPQSSLLPNVDSNLRTWNEGTSHETRGLSQAFDQQPNPVPAAHQGAAEGGTNQWTTGIQNNGEMDRIEELSKQLFSD